MKTLGVLVLISTLAGCATCREHPVACTVAGAIVVGSVAASVQHHDQAAQVQVNPVPRPVHP